ncbi:MAG TPA: hypothetical protein PLF13_14050 [candidate division Zixibacteria bacterium]|nr:hypothetical protein [candidate division Zixibacteria bacterium]
MKSTLRMRAGLFALLISLWLLAAVLPGCEYNITIENGHWVEVKDSNGTIHKECKSGGHECIIGCASASSGK